MRKELKVFVTNTSGSVMELPELGGYELQPDEEVELTADEYYGRRWQAASRALFDLDGTVLYQQRVAGNLTVRYEPVMDSE